MSSSSTPVRGDGHTEVRLRWEEGADAGAKRGECPEGAEVVGRVDVGGAAGARAFPPAEENGVPAGEGDVEQGVELGEGSLVEQAVEAGLRVAGAESDTESGEDSLISECC